MDPKFKYNNLWLGIVSFLNDVSSEMIFPILPLFLVLILRLSNTEIGLIEGVALASASFFQGFSGYIADRRGKRKDAVALGYLFSSITKPLLSLATSASQVLGLRLLDRAGKGIREAPRDTLISFSVDAKHRGRAFGLNRTLDTAGGVVGSLIVYFILRYWPLNEALFRKIFSISFWPAIVGVIIILIFVREVPHQAAAGEKRVFDWHKVSRHARFFFLISAIFSLANASYAFFILRAVGGGNYLDSALYYLVFSLFSGLLFFPIGQWTDARGRSRALLWGYLVFALVCFGFINPPAGGAIFWPLFVLYGLAIALTDGVGRSLLSDLIHPDVRATAFGIYHGLNGLALFGGSFIFGRLWDKAGADLAFSVSGSIALLAAMLFVVYLYKHRGHGHFGEPHET